MFDNSLAFNPTNFKQADLSLALTFSKKFLFSDANCPISGLLIFIIS